MGVPLFSRIRTLALAVFAIVLFGRMAFTTFDEGQPDNTTFDEGQPHKTALRDTSNTGLAVSMGAEPAAQGRQPRAGAGGGVVQKTNSKSQFGQDIWASTQAPRGGFYLDIGAYHGDFLSNTKAIDELGWRGMCIEPLKYDRGWEHRSCEFVPKALVPKMPPSGNVTFTDCEAGHPRGGKNLVDLKYLSSRGAGQQLGQSGHSGLSDFVDHSKREVRPCLQVAVPAVTMESLLSSLPRVIEYASLDVEGAEAALLRAMPWSELCVESWSVENQGSDRQQREVRAALLDHSPHPCKHVKRSGVDDYFTCDCSALDPAPVPSLEGSALRA